MTHLPIARASMDVVATTSLVLQLTNTCMNVMHVWHQATKLHRFAG